ncbi:NEL-type E3 ubiquitin ligase domain-containing protein [Pseudomonas tolaasii]|uniref:NEL-type E3 ubiquitin ligase domain-containing protein n=1 Tax=Pseudomonas tolaasii TaxID=29442 RepID=UPI0002D8D546|nr:NEL-type E3 ubiquitin ligase domain-containing protein [Pseudomonas tolaasii]
MADLPAAPPAATLSIHRDYLEQASPAWLTDATPSRRAQLKQAAAPVPDWYRNATPAQLQTLHDKTRASFTAQTALDKAMAPVQDIDAFAEPLLVKALSEQFKVDLDVHKTLLVLRKPLEVTLFDIRVGHFEVLRIPLLQAALHNFEEGECTDDAFDRTSGFFTLTAAGGNIEPVTTPLTVVQFTRLCRSLDIGAQYQRHLKSYLKPTDPVAERTLRETFISARKADLAAAAEAALLSKDIEPADHAMILSMINGERHPWMGDKQVWLRDLGLMKKRMIGCVAFVIVKKYRYGDEVILYIPNDPFHPLKRYNWAQFAAMFKQRFNARDQPDPGDGTPTAYQQFFSQFVAYADLPDYFAGLTEEAPAANFGAALAPYAPLLNTLNKGINPFAALTGIKELPPIAPRARLPNPDPYLNPGSILIKGRGLWEENPDLWDHLYTRHRDKILNDAAAHAVPTADVDARVRSAKIAALLNAGLMVLNTVSMFVPVLGEVMMTVMAGQLLYETFEGSLEWAEGDRRAAKAHLVDVAENLATLAVMAGVGKVVSSIAAARPEPLIEALDPVTLPNGQVRLGKSDLKGYASPDTLPADITPNARGQYLHAGKTYIRPGDGFYEKTYDAALGRWRIRHPTNPDAYQPVLRDNGFGAWRHTLERPQTWDRQTLMRRLGPVTDGFDDEQLLSIADISATSDGALRQMYLDETPLPAALADTLRLFKADRDVAQVIEQISTGKAVDDRYLYVLPLLTDMPRWPVGRVLEVFEGADLAGPVQRYGTERLYHGVVRKAPIRISRADVLGSQMPARILAALDESEIVGMLGGEPARVPENRPLELRKQLADFARSRQPALFDSLYKGTELPDPFVAKLQRLYPGLSEHAAQQVLADADAEQIARLRATGRVPLAMQEHARWQVSQGRLGRAYTGLHMQNLVSADSKRLALHTLSKLPGWSDQLRIEVREGSISGTLLDGIGSEAASQRKYLVKRGPQYQAFNERGETLNSLGRDGDNFYASLMHAMPDEARQAIGLPHVGQSLELRRAIIDYATAHRLESARLIKQQSSPRPTFKPPQRIGAKGLGYPASGRGQGTSPSLVSRVQDVYPQMTEDQANGFILRQMLADKSDAQIFTLLNNRLSEWRQLESTLDTWMLTESTDLFIRRYPQMDSRPGIVRALKACWRNAPLAELPGHAELQLVGEFPLPPLSADFSHVRTLNVGGRGMIDGHIDQLLGYFPNVQELTLAGADTPPFSVPQALEGMGQLRQLKIFSGTGLSTEELNRLQGLTGLEQLDLHSTLGSLQPLDVSRLRRLRSLRLSGGGQKQFPLGALELSQLQRLDLKASSIDQLPDQLFAPGQESQWAKLSMNWASFNRERFRAAYEFVRNHPEHLIDQDEMVREYCGGLLDEGLGRKIGFNTPLSGPLKALFFERWTSSQAQFDAIEALSGEYAELSRSLDNWLTQDAQNLQRFARTGLAESLRKAWNDGLLQRFGRLDPVTLTVPGLVVSDMPHLPAGLFDAVATLQMPNAIVPSAQLSRFLRGFGGLRSLDVSGASLTELTVAPGEWPALEHLNLANNPLQTLDVSGLNQLTALNLRASHLSQWPTGAEHLPQLTWLDLRDTRITQLPATALAEDRLLLDSQFSGLPLTPKARAELGVARQRVERNLGLEDATLSRFEQQPMGEVFPPRESGSAIARQLLPMPVTDAIEAGLTRCLNSWLFTREFSRSSTLKVTAGARRVAAQRILDCWRASQSRPVGEAAVELNFHGLTLGELPALPVTLHPVERLNLNGVQLTGPGSDAFLRAFPEVKTLTLSGNQLVSLPPALEGMALLERLDLSGVGISDPERLYPTLEQIENLRWLDVSYCDLETFSLDTLDGLESLNLSNNELAHWPDGVLRATQLRTLDLSSNPLEAIPPGALEGEHDALMAGTDLSENFNFDLEDLRRLQAYARRVGSDTALGMSSADVQQQISELEHPTSSDTESEPDEAEEFPVLPDEVLREAPVTAADRETWLHNLPADEQARLGELWDQLAHEPDNAAFFNLLSLLPQTKDFDLARASLTARVWRVIEAAGSNAELRETLFGMSNTHGTCSDGRILTFSALEIKVLEFDILRDLDPTDLARKGSALLSLSRNLFRLEQVEQLAARHIRPNSDAAEVRLQYLIGLRRRLDLQGVPEKMRYATPIGGATMEGHARAIEALEHSDAFHENLISRDYWVAYLKERYPEDIAALEQRNAQKRDALEDAFASVNDVGYVRGLETLNVQLLADETQTLMALSRRAEEALNPSAHDPSQPGTSAGLRR